MMQLVFGENVDFELGFYFAWFKMHVLISVGYLI